MDAAQGKELVGRVQFLVGDGEREEQRLRPEDLLEQGGGRQRAGDDRLQYLLVRVDRSQGFRGCGDRRVRRIDAIGGPPSPLLLGRDPPTPRIATFPLPSRRRRPA